MAMEMPDIQHPPPDIKVWRRATREALLTRRISSPAQARRSWTAAIVRELGALWPALEGRVLGFCWPYKAEPNLLPVVREWMAAGRLAALPVVVQAKAPMRFRRWFPEAPMVRGVYDIPIPADTEEVRPDVLLAPLVGFDGNGFRLGYGGGYFDRTVVALSPRPLLIGVGFELSRLTTIFPQPHDQPMDWILTEAGVHRHRRPPAG